MKKVHKTPSAEKRFPHLFQITNEVINQLHEWIDLGQKPEVKTAPDVVYIASATRTFNLYRSIVLLLEKDHWEDAAILTRSMFELLLNIEEIQRDTAIVESKSQQFLRFEMLQRYLHARAINQYDIDTGRLSNTDHKLSEVDKVAELLFRDFLVKTQSGKKKWRTSWCGKNIWELAEASEQPIRKRQYDVLYSYMSAFSHSAPLSVMTTVGLAESLEDKDFEKLQLAHEEKEETQLKLILSLSTIFILEIIFRVRAVLLDYDIRWNLQILKKIFNLYGVEPPPSPI